MNATRVEVRRLSRQSRRLRRPGLHWPSIRGRAGADRGPLLMAGLVVTLATLLSAAVPPSVRNTSDDAVNHAVAEAGDRATLQINAPFEYEDEFSPRTRQSSSAAVVDQNADVAQSRLGADLAAVLRPPVSSVTSPDLKVTGTVPGRTLELAYLAGGQGAEVVWTAGQAPASSVPQAQQDTAVASDTAPWPVQVGLTQETAARLGAKPGDKIPAASPTGGDLDVRVTGIFRAVTPTDPAWLAAPRLLRPEVHSNGVFNLVAMAALMTKDSLPDGRLALDPKQIQSVVTFTPEPTRLRLADAESLATRVVALKASSGSSDGMNVELTWQSSLDAVLREAEAAVAAATAQASVLLVALITTAALVLLLAAELLVRRRASALAGARMRGASLAGIGVELLIESVLVAGAGWGLGLVLSRALAGGASWRWPLPVVLIAVLAGPVLGVGVAARATSGRRAPANRSARQSAVRTRQLRRLTLELALVLAAAAAFVSLRQRGIVPAGSGPAGSGGSSLLPALAPTLGAAAGALVLLRLLPLAAGLALSRAARSRRSLPLLAAARTAATIARPLPFLVLVLSSALLTFAAAVSTTETDGQDQGAWQAVGADARLDVTPSSSVPQLARQVAATPGVRQVLSARIVDRVTVSTTRTSTPVRLVVVDAAAFQRLLAASPLPDAAQLSRLTGRAAAGGRVPALLRTGDPDLRAGTGLGVRWDDAVIPLTAVGPAPAVGTGTDDVLIVDAAAFARAGADAAPNTLWVVGPAAARAARAAAGPDDVVTVRAAVLRERRSAPLAAGLLRLGRASLVVLLLLGLLAVALGAAAGAPARGEMLARLRTLGLRPREARQVAAGELLPPVLIGAVGGLGLGLLLAHAALGPLDLRLLTGQATDPALVVPGLVAVPVLLLVGAVAVVVAVESSLRRRERLGQILRAGNT